MPRKVVIKSTEEWLSLVPKDHQNKHGYERAVYTGSDNFLTITCRIHGDFEQRAYSHQSGAGCLACARLKSGQSQKGSKESFVSKTDSVPAIAGLYDYVKVKYVNGTTPVEIICSKHGSFMMSPGNHLSGKGCRKCYDERRYLNNSKDNEQYKSDVANKHGHTYDHSLVQYKGAKCKVQVICKLHGPFWIAATNHLSGQGCPKCNTSGYNNGKPGYLYILIADDITKVGITTRTPEHRIREVAKDGGPSFTVISSYYFMDGTIPQILEHKIHRYLEQHYKRVDRTFDGSTECFIDVNLAALLNFVTPLATTEAA
jgi:hypothetical protein